MPYPALPPELPPIISIAAETAHCSSLVDVVNPISTPASIASATSRPAPPESFPPTAAKLASNSLSNPTHQTSPSCAALLGNTIAVGHLTTGKKPITSRGKTAPVQPDPPVAPPPAIAHPEPGEPSPESAASAGVTTAERLNKSQVSYSVSGVAGALANTPEAALMERLHQAVVFEGLVESLEGLRALTAADLARLAQAKSSRTAQVGQVPNTLPGGASPTPVSPTPVPRPTTPPAETLFPPGDGRSQVAPVEVPPLLEDRPIPNPNPNPIPASPAIDPANVVEVTADRQDYDERNQIFTAEGKVMMRVRGALLEADRVQVNLTNRLTVAEGNVALTRGSQVLRGQRFDYNLVQGTGTVQRARGEINLASIDTDTTVSAESGTSDQTILARPLSDRITSQQPVQNVGSAGGVSLGVGVGRDINRISGGAPQGGQLKRLRFEAEQIDFTPEGWEARNIDITNDPFSPPELVLRAERARLTRLSPLQDEVVATRPRLVFDQKVAVPVLRRRFLIDRSERDPTFFRFGIDGQDRGGVFVEGIVNVIQSRNLNLSIYPQIFLQRMIVDSESEGIGDLDNYGVRARLNAVLSPTLGLNGRVNLDSLDFDKVDSRLRASVRLQQAIATSFGPHRLALEYSFRDRLFNGSLGFQTVQTSLGALFLSPDIALGSGFVLNYQAGYQVVTADTDRLDLLEPIRDDNRVTLGRFQTTAAIGRTFGLWQGKALPATRDAGLNYTPNPVTPYVSLGLSLRGVFSSYTSGDTQEDLLGTVSLYGQFGNFSRKFFDFTAIGIYYTQVVGAGDSPFLFDRSVDNRVLTLSLLQQLYGPVRAGVQASINLDTGDNISTDYFLEYSRRTHGIIIRYNPVLEIGSIGFRISDFNWTGTAEPFEGAGVTPVEGGVQRRY